MQIALCVRCGGYHGVFTLLTTKSPPHVSRKRYIPPHQRRHTPAERYLLVIKVNDALAEHSEMSVQQACHEVGVAPSNYRRWWDRLKQHPEYHHERAIPTQSKRPKQLTRQTSNEVRQRVIHESQQPQHTSANSITQQLTREGFTIGTSKVIEILETEGLYGEIQVKKANGEWVRKRGLLRLCEKRQQGT